MKAAKRTVRAVYETRRRAEKRSGDLREAIDGLNAEAAQTWRESLGLLVKEAGAVDKGSAAGELASDVVRWASLSLQAGDDSAAWFAFELGRAVERLNVQLNTASQLVLAKLEADAVNRRNGAKGGRPRDPKTWERARSFLQKPENRTKQALQLRFCISESTARRWLSLDRKERRKSRQ